MIMNFYKKLFFYIKGYFLKSNAFFLTCNFILISVLIIVLSAGCTVKSPDFDENAGADNNVAQSETTSGDSGQAQQANEEKESGKETPGKEESGKISSDADKPASLSIAKEGSFIADGTVSDEEYSGYLKIEDFEIYWANDSENIFIAMVAPAEGFVSIGIQPGNMMKDADIILGYVDDILVTIYDMHSTGNFGPHPPDVELGGTDDILDFDGSQDNGVTVIEFKRLLATGDSYDNDLMLGANKIIWAYGKADGPDGSHSKRGYLQIEIK